MESGCEGSNYREAAADSGTQEGMPHAEAPIMRYELSGQRSGAPIGAMLPSEARRADDRWVLGHPLGVVGRPLARPFLQSTALRQTRGQLPGARPAGINPPLVSGLRTPNWLQSRSRWPNAPSESEFPSGESAAYWRVSKRRGSSAYRRRSIADPGSGTTRSRHTSSEVARHQAADAAAPTGPAVLREPGAYR
jgi:hypothetical protein